MKTRVAIAVVIFFSGQGLQAQALIDSLWQRWQNQSLHDTVRLNALQDLAYRYAPKNPDSSRILGETERAYAREKNLPRWEARALNAIGLSYRFQSDFVKALQYYQQSIDLLQKIGDRNYMAAVYGNMGDVYRVQSNLPKAIDCITQSLALAEETGDRKRAADAYVSIAIMYFDQPNSQGKILEYLEKARVIYEDLKHERGLSLVYANLATVYFNQNMPEKSLLYLDKSLVLQEKGGDVYGLATSLFNRASLRSNQGRFREALADFGRVEAYFKQLGDQEGLADTYNGLGDLWIRQKRYDIAIQMCSKGLRIAREMGSPNMKETEACECLHTAHKKKGNFKQALEYLEAFMAANDSLRQSETAEKLKQMEIKQQMAADSLQREKDQFQVEIEHEQAIQRKDRTMGLLTAIGLGVLTAALAIWGRMLYFRRRSEQLEERSESLEKQQLLNEIALFRTQVNPHFLFNSLSILSSLVHTNAELSEQFIDQLSRSYRYILEQKEQSLVTLRTELEFIQSYTFLLKIRFEEKFDLRIQLNESVLEQHKIAPLTLQLLVENAVKHNRMSAKEPLVIEVYLENDFLVVKNPFRPRPQRLDSTGTGLSNIIQRYALLTQHPVWAGEREGDFVVKLPLL